MRRIICAIISIVFLLNTTLSDLALAKNLKIPNSSNLRPALLLGNNDSKARVAKFLESRSVCGLIAPQEGAESPISAIVTGNNPRFGVEIAFRGERNRVLELIRFAVREAEKIQSKTIIVAGTVLNRKDALDAIEAGVSLIVTPGLTLSKEDIDEIHQKGAMVVMGVGSKDEALEAAIRGADTIKVFPFNPKGKHMDALKGPMPAALHEYLNKVELVERGEAELATFTNVHNFLQAKPMETKQFRLPKSDRELVDEVRAAVPDKPILITGGVSTDMMVGGLLDSLNVGAALSIASPANVDEVLWVLTASEEAKNLANQIKKALKGPFDRLELVSLDGLVDALVMENPAVCKELLGKGAPKTVAACIIERLALPDVAQSVLSTIRKGMFVPDIREYIEAAKGNPDIRSKALGVQTMVDELTRGDFTSFVLPERPEVLAKCSDSDIIDGITSIRHGDPSDNLPHISYRSQEAWRDFVELMKRDNKINDLTKPPRIPILEQHPNANQYFYVEEGELVMLVTTAKDQRLRDYVVKKGEIVKVGANVYHIAVNKTTNVKFWVYNEDSVRAGEKVAKVMTNITCIGRPFEIQDAFERNPVNLARSGLPVNI